MQEITQNFLLVPCGGTTLPGVVMRRAVLRILERTNQVRILDLAPYLAGIDTQEGLLNNIPPSRRIAISGCSECCPHMALTTRDVEVGHHLHVNCRLSDEEAIEDIISRVFSIVGG